VLGLLGRAAGAGQAWGRRPASNGGPRSPIAARAARRSCHCGARQVPQPPAPGTARRWQELPGRGRPPEPVSHHWFGSGCGPRSWTWCRGPASTQVQPLSCRHLMVKLPSPGASRAALDQCLASSVADLAADVSRKAADSACEACHPTGMV